MVDLFQFGLQPTVQCKGLFALGSITESLHFHATNTLPNRLRQHLRWTEVHKLYAAKIRARQEGQVGKDPEHLSFLLSSQTHAAVRAATAFVAGLLLKQCYQILHHLQEAKLLADTKIGKAVGDKGRPWQLFRYKRRDGVHPLGRFARSAAALAAKGVEHQKSLDPESAVACFEEALKLAPGNVEYLMFVAKQWSDFSFMPNCPKEQRLPSNEKALGYARQIIENNPESAVGYICSCMSKGRLAYWHHDNKQKINFAKEAQDEVVQALQLDPNSDLAHHLMGRWHYEMAQLNFVVRSLIRVMYGTSLLPGSVPDALASYQRAAELNPARLVHRVEVGRMLQKLGQEERALEELKAALVLEVEDINSHINKQEAEEMVAHLEKKLRITRPAMLCDSATPEAPRTFSWPVYGLL